MKSILHASKISLCVFIVFWTYSSFAEKIVFLPVFSIEESYNENIFYFDSNKADDFITSLIAAFPFEFSSHSKKLALQYSPRADFYRKYDELNYVGHYFSSTYDYIGKKSDLKITDLFSSTKTQAEEVRYQEFPIGLLGRTDILTNYFDMSYGVRIRDVSSFNFKLSHGLLKYKDLQVDGESIVFEDTQTFSGEMENLFSLRSIRNRLGYFYNFRKFLFETFEDSTSNSLGFVLRLEYPKQLHVMLKGGASKIQTQDSIESGDDVYELFYFDLSKDLRRGSVRLAFSRDTSVGGGYGGISLDDRLFIRLSNDISTRSTFNISSEYYNRDPIEESFVGYNAVAISSSIDFKINPKVLVYAAHRYFLQDSKEDALDARFNIISFGIRVSPFQKSF